MLYHEQVANIFESGENWQYDSGRSSPIWLQEFTRAYQNETLTAISHVATTQWNPYFSQGQDILLFKGKVFLINETSASQSRNSLEKSLLLSTTVLTYP
jgi:hypothetical protein